MKAYEQALSPLCHHGVTGLETAGCSTPELVRHGVYQIGDVYARSVMVIAVPASGLIP
jgi:hypothetical protein